MPDANKDRLVSGDIDDLNEAQIEKSLRPRRLAQYIGQDRVKHQLTVYITAAKQREESLDHVLLYGPPGLGQNHAGTGDCQRNGCEYPYHFRTGH